MSDDLKFKAFEPFVGRKSPVWGVQRQIHGHLGEIVKYVERIIDEKPSVDTMIKNYEEDEDPKVIYDGDKLIIPEMVFKAMKTEDQITVSKSEVANPFKDFLLIQQEKQKEKDREGKAYLVENKMTGDE